MSRLFEALSSLQKAGHPQKLDTRPGDTAETVPPIEMGLGVFPPEFTQDLKTGNDAPQSSRIRPVPQTKEPVSAAPARITPATISVTDALSSRVGKSHPPSAYIKASPDSRLVALTDPNGLGAEKFRALVARLDDMRKEGELRSFQVTSSVINEGKSLVAGNLAVTLSKYSGSRTLLIEGDLHRPTLATQMGLNSLRGLNEWWSTRDQGLGAFIYKLHDMPLWFLSAGKPCDRASDILRSARFAKAFSQLASEFEWIVVDSTPMLPIVDVNLWSKLVDGTLLVVRHGITPLKALKNGLQALDGPKLIGVVVNDALPMDHENYEGSYYGPGKNMAGRHGKMS
jgi:capsular exopolysaccharide synthesis family protein